MKKNLARIAFLLDCLAVLIPAAQAQPTISIASIDASSAETWPGQTPDTGTVRLTRTGSTASSFTINARLRGDAVLGADYTTAPAFVSTLTFPAGQSNINLTITPVDDLVTELQKFVRVEIQSPNVAGQYLIAGQGRAEVTIADNDDPNTPLRANVNVAALSPTAAEGTNGVIIPGTFRITRDVNTNVNLTVAYQVGGSATPGDDFPAPSGSVVIPPGETFADVIVTPVDDGDLEGSETVSLTILPSACPGIFPPPPECYTIGDYASATLTLLDNEIPPPLPVVTLNAAQDSSVYGLPATVNGSFLASATNGFIASYVVRLDGAVKFSASTDYTNTPTAGTPLAFNFVLTNLSGGYHTVSAIVTDDGGLSGMTNKTIFIYAIPPPFVPATYAVSAVDAEAAETNPGETGNPGKFRIVRTGTPGDLEFYYYTFTGTARQGIDYTYSYGATTYTTNGFTNVMTQEIIINPLNDAFVEGTETIGLQLCFPIIVMIYGVGAPIGTSCGDITTMNLLDNDTEPLPYSVVSASASDADAEEVSVMSGQQQNPGAFTITRTAPMTNDLAVAYSLAGLAKSGVDYEALSGVAIIPTGSPSVEVTVNPIFDTWVEGNEAVTLALSPPSTNGTANYLLDPSANNSPSVIIHDYAPTNIPIVSVTANDAQAIEENVYSRTGSFLVTRTGSTTADFTLPYQLDGTASNGVDYATLPGLVTIPAASPSASILVNPIADGVAEPIETVGLTLETPSPDIFPPPYLFSTAATKRNFAGVTIRDTALYPGHPYLTKRQRLLLRRFPNRHVVIPLPATVFNDPSLPPPADQPTITWAVEATSDLATWEEIGTTQDPEEFVDVTAGDAAQRFYRFRQVPPASP